jgi:hypothetical protein
MHIYHIQLPQQIYKKRAITIPNDCEVNIAKIPFNNQFIDHISIDKEYHREKFGFELSNCELFDFLTHYDIWKTFLETGEKYALIIESNVKLVITSEQLFETLSSFPDDLDLYFPYDTFEYIDLHPATGGTLLNRNIRELRRIESYELDCKWGNSIYFISRNGVEKLIKINCIKDRLDNTFVSMTRSGELNLYYANESWFDYDNIDWREWSDRIDLIWNAILNASSWNKERMLKVRELLKLLSDVCVESGVKPLLQGGSHLGCVQHGGIMPWDDDVDIGIEKSQTGRLVQSLSKHKDIRFKEFIEWGTNAPYYKIWDVNGEKIENHKYTFPFIDIWMYEVKGPDIVFLNGITCKDSALKDLTEVNFEGGSYYIPHNSLDVLDSRYTRWRTNILVYTWNHRLEKFDFYPLCVPIETDSEGRFLRIKNSLL